MEFKSGFLDNLQLLLNKRYIVSDKELNTLSDIILELDLVDVAEDGILINLLIVLDENNLRFPVSYNLLKELWEKTSLTVSFKRLLSRMNLKGLIKLKKISEPVFFNSLNIDKSSSDVQGKKDYLCVYGTSLWNNFRKEVEEYGILKKTYKDIGMIKISEGINLGNLDTKYKTFIKSTLNLVKTKLLIKPSIESFDYDSYKDEIEFNFTFEIPRLLEGTIKNKDLIRIFKKWCKDADILGLESYIDGREKIFFSVLIDLRAMSKDLSLISKNIYSALSEILDLVEEG